MFIKNFCVCCISFAFFSFTTPIGISYRHITNDIPQSIHVLEVDAECFAILPAVALDKYVGREDVLSLSKRKNALAAINGGYFSIGKHDGAAAGILKINQQWYGLATKPRAAIGWTKDCKTVVFDRVLTHIEGIDVIVDSQNSSQEDWDQVDHIVGGAGLLIQNNQKITDFSPENTLKTFLYLRHARTAIGLLENGNWVLVVVDGKQPKLSRGMTMYELADFMQELGCTNALNLDGGGSSTFVYQNQVLNEPTGDGDDDDEAKRILRPVSDAILVTMP